VDNGEDWKQRANASNLIEALITFDFIFSCFFMRKVLGITDELSQALQRKEQDIMNAMLLVAIAKSRLQNLRDNGWDSLLAEVQSFCSISKIDVLNMEDTWVAKRSQRGVQGMTNRHFYCVEFFYAVIDMLLQELNNRFTEGSTELLRCISCLNPSNNFHAFDKVKLIELAKFYPNDFSGRELCILEPQLECYIYDVQNDDEFSQLNGMGDLAEKLVVKRKNLVYPLVYKLIKLALILPVATASVERAFSSMSIIKTRLRNRMGDEWMNDNLVTYIEKDVFRCVTNETIMQKFQNMKTRRGLLLLLE
jgi:hAT family C-terminal dimerisation region